MVRNVLGTQVLAKQQIPFAKLGFVKLTDVDVHISLAEESSVRVERWLQGEAIIGIEILSDFRARIDYPRGKLGLTPVRTLQPGPLEGPELDAIPGIPQT